MKQTLDDLITGFSVVSQLETTEDNLIRKYYSLDGIVSIATLGKAFLLEPKPASHALRAFLEAVPENVLYSILVLMYAGRDEDEDILGCVDSLCKTLSSREAVIAIYEKAPRMEYIGKGIQYLGCDNLNVLLEEVSKKLSP